MKALLIAALVALAAAAPFLTQSEVDQYNSAQDLWTAELSPRFAHLTEEEITGMFGTRVPEDIIDLPQVDYSAIREFQDLPESHDTRTKWPNCVGAIRDQGNCGSCWAFGAIEAFEDRHCIVSGAGSVTFHSPQALVDCDPGSFGCGGGWPVKAFEYIRDQGVPTETCYPYKARDGNCVATCKDGTPWVRRKSVSVHAYKSINDVKTCLFNNGPVETWFAVYRDFLTYKSGVYAPTTSQLLGYHATEVNGWGVENGVSYWISRNSWGKTWGDKGYFKIKAGTCQFDQLDHFVAGEVKP